VRAFYAALEPAHPTREEDLEQQREAADKPGKLTRSDHHTRAVLCELSQPGEQPEAFAVGGIDDTDVVYP
jgi:hypothetical protein